MIVNKDSWHYWLATESGPLTTYQIEKYGVDSCQYKAAVIAGVIILLASILMGLIMLGVLIILSFAPLFTSSFWFPMMISCFMWVINYKILSYFLQEFSDQLPDWMNKEILPRGKIKTPSFIKQSFKEFKEKYCSKVEVVKDKEDNIFDY